MSLDYLLKDELEEEENLKLSEDVPPVKRVTMEEASRFLSVKAAGGIGMFVLLAIVAAAVSIFIANESKTAPFPIWIRRNLKQSMG